MSKATERKQKEHRDAPANDQPVTYRRRGTRGESLVRALVDHGDTRPSRVAEIIAQHPADQDEIIEFIQDYFGNGFANKVLHALPAAERADEFNHDMSDHVGKKDRGGLESTGPGSDPNRLTDDGHLATVDGSAEDPVPVVRNDGSMIGTIDKQQPLRVDAGAVSKIAVQDEDGEATECVLGFKVSLSDGRNVAGWVPVDGLGDDAHTRAVVKKDRAVARRLKRRRPGGKDLKNTSAWRVNLAADTSRFEGLFVKPKQDTNENKAEHYCKRPTTNVVNLLVNIPDTGGSRFGVPCDVLADGTPFNRIDNVAKGHTPLWLPDSEQQAPQFLTFVYGYTVNSAGTRTYGWINEAMIERAEKGE